MFLSTLIVHVPIHTIKPFLKANVRCSKYQIFGNQTFSKWCTMGKFHRWRSALFSWASQDRYALNSSPPLSSGQGPGEVCGDVAPGSSENFNFKTAYSDTLSISEKSYWTNATEAFS